MTIDQILAIHRRKKRITWKQVYYLLKKVALSRYRIKEFAEPGVLTSQEEKNSPTAIPLKLEHSGDRVLYPKKPPIQKPVVAEVNTNGPSLNNIIQTALVNITKPKDQPLKNDLNTDALAETIVSNIIQEIRNRSENSRRTSVRNSFDFTGSSQMTPRSEISHVGSPKSVFESVSPQIKLESTLLDHRVDSSVKTNGQMVEPESSAENNVEGVNGGERVNDGEVINGGEEEIKPQIGRAVEEKTVEEEFLSKPPESTEKSGLSPLQERILDSKIISLNIHGTANPEMDDWLLHQSMSTQFNESKSKMPGDSKGPKADSSSKTKVNEEMFNTILSDKSHDLNAKSQAQILMQMDQTIIKTLTDKGRSTTDKREIPKNHDETRKSEGDSTDRTESESGDTPLVKTPVQHQPNRPIANISPIKFHSSELSKKLLNESINNDDIHVQESFLSSVHDSGSIHANNHNLMSIEPETLQETNENIADKLIGESQRKK